MAELSNIGSILRRIINGVTGVSAVYPTGANPVALTASVGAWGVGAWVTVIAANTLTSHSLTGLAMTYINNGNYAVVQIGTGGAGSEVVIGEFPSILQTAAGAFNHVPIVPAIQIPANARVAARVTGNGTSGVINLYATFTPRPF